MAEPYAFPRLLLEARLSGAEVAPAQALWDILRAVLLAGAPDRAAFLGRLHGLLRFWVMAMGEVTEGDPAVVLAELAMALRWSGLDRCADDWDDIIEALMTPTDTVH